jgi:tetratricopeptide (TPR) repeat protein
VLQCAAAIGKDVPFDLLLAIAGAGEDELRQSLRRLQAGEFLHEMGLSLARAYTFTHALTLEVAYGTLLRERRRELHARIVEEMERAPGLPGTEQVERLAHHAVQGERWERAVRYGREAGVRAFARSAHRTAVRYFEHALRALEHVPDSPEALAQAIDLRLDLRYSLSPLGDFGRMLDHLKAAEQLAERAGDRRRSGLVAAFLTNYFTVTLDLRQAAEYGRRAVAIAAEVEDVAVEALANTFFALARYGSGEYRPAIHLARRNVELLRGPLARERFGMALLPGVYSRTVLVWSLAELGEFAAAAEAGEDAIRLAESVDHPYSLIFACLGPGLLHLRQGDHARAIPVLERALRVCESVGLAAVHAAVAGPLASAYALAGRADDALHLVRRAVEHAIAIGDPLGHWIRTGNRAEALLAAGRAAEALPLARRGLDLTRLVRGRGLEGWALRLSAEAAAAQDPPLLDDAQASFEEALARADAAGMRPLAARCHLGLGLVALRAGKTADGRQRLEHAAALLAELGMRPWLEQARRELARAGPA